MTLKYKLLTFKRNVNFAIVLGGELNSYYRVSSVFGSRHLKA